MGTSKAVSLTQPADEAARGPRVEEKALAEDGPPDAESTVSAQETTAPEPSVTDASAGRKPLAKKASGSARRGSGRSSPSVEQVAFVLHTIPYRETSLVVEFFGQKSGRFAAVAKGAKRPRSNLRAVAQMFQPLIVRSSGQNDLHNLNQADWQGGILLPQGQALISSFYLNELLMRLLHRDDPQERLFEAYYSALEALGASASTEAIEIGLRQFEWTLLQEAGYAPDLSRDGQGREIRPDKHYRWETGHGFLVARSPAPGLVAEPSRSSNAGSLVVSGQTLQDLAQSQFGSERGRLEMKLLMRKLLAEQLGGKPLKTRQIFRHLQDFVAES